MVTNVIYAGKNDDVFHLAAKPFRDRIKSEKVLEVRGGVVMSVENGNVVTYLLRKVLAILSFFLGMGFFLSGCTLSASSVKLHTKEEMQKILEERYGDAEFVSMEENKEKHQRIFTFRDKKYGFTYQVTSHPRGVGLDGSNFYYDGASVYYEYHDGDRRGDHRSVFHLRDGYNALRQKQRRVYRREQQLFPVPDEQARAVRSDEIHRHIA